MKQFCKTQKGEIKSEEQMVWSPFKCAECGQFFTARVSMKIVESVKLGEKPNKSVISKMDETVATENHMTVVGENGILLVLL